MTAAVIGSVAWSVSLFVLDITSAKPQVVSRDQILAADIVVMARPVAGERDQIEVVRVFQGDVAAGEQQRVLNLAEIPHLASGQDYLLALSQTRRGLVLTKLEGQHVPPLVYQSTPAAVEEVKSILRDHL